MCDLDYRLSYLLSYRLRYRLRYRFSYTPWLLPRPRHRSRALLLPRPLRHRRRRRQHLALTTANGAPSLGAQTTSAGRCWARDDSAASSPARDFDLLDLLGLQVDLASHVRDAHLTFPSVNAAVTMYLESRVLCVCPLCLPFRLNG